MGRASACDETSLPWLGCCSVDFEWLGRERTLVGSNLTEWHLKNDAVPPLGWGGGWQPPCQRSPEAGARKQGPWSHRCMGITLPGAARSWRAPCFAALASQRWHPHAELSKCLLCLCPFKSRCQSWLSKASLFLKETTGQGAGRELQCVALSRPSRGQRVTHQPEKASKARLKTSSPRQTIKAASRPAFANHWWLSGIWLLCSHCCFLSKWTPSSVKGSNLSQIKTEEDFHVISLQKANVQMKPPGILCIFVMCICLILSLQKGLLLYHHS